MAGEIVLDVSSSDDYILTAVLANRPISKIVVTDSRTAPYKVNTVEDFTKVYQTLLEETKTLLGKFLATRDPIATAVSYFVVIDPYQYADPFSQTSSYFRKLMLVKDAVNNLTEDVVTVCYKARYELSYVNPEVAKSVGSTNNTLEVQHCEQIRYRENIVEVLAKVASKNEKSQR